MKVIHITCITTLVLGINNHVHSAPPKLPNVQQTCYLNATLQCLHNAQELRDFILDIPPQGNLLPTVQETLRTMKNEQQKYDAPNLTNNGQFKPACQDISQIMQHQAGSIQQDATEFFMRLQQDIKSAALKSQLMERYRKLLEAPPFTFGLSEIIFIGFAKNWDTLTSGIQKNMSAQGVTDHLPHYIIFAWQQPNRSDLMPAEISLDTTLLFTKPNSSTKSNAIPIIHQEANIDTVRYQLNSTAVFTGGHYVAYVNRNNTWWLCDDATVTRTSLPETWNPNNRYPYLIFYERIPETSDITGDVQSIKTNLENVYQSLNVIYRQLQYAQSTL